jgi:hypothetical protein
MLIIHNIMLGNKKINAVVYATEQYYLTNKKINKGVFTKMCAEFNYKPCDSDMLEWYINVYKEGYWEIVYLLNILFPKLSKLVNPIIFWNFIDDLYEISEIPEYFVENVVDMFPNIPKPSIEIFLRIADNNIYDAIYVYDMIGVSYPFSHKCKHVIKYCSDNTGLWEKITEHIPEMKYMDNGGECYEIEDRLYFVNPGYSIPNSSCCKYKNNDIYRVNNEVSTFVLSNTLLKRLNIK